jgi:hypothetical protein
MKEVKEVRKVRKGNGSGRRRGKEIEGLKNNKGGKVEDKGREMRGIVDAMMTGTEA